MIRGPDVASYQHPNGANISWAKVAKSGIRFAIIKATEGTDYVNPYFAGDYAGALKAGLVHGSYHFARPALPIASTARAQAAYYADQIGSVKTKSTLPPALDFEVTGGLDQVQLIRWGQAFLIDVEQRTGRVPMLYTYPSFWSSTLADPAAFARYPIWMASITKEQPEGATLWQFTAAGRIPGISGYVDEDRYVSNGTWPWSKIDSGANAPAITPSVPGAPQSVLAESVGNDSATVTWLPGDAGTAPVSGYTVTAKPGGAHVTVGPGVTSATVSGLTAGTAYRFTVAAANSVGAGTPSIPSNTVTAVETSTMTTATQAPIAAGDDAVVSGTLTADGKPLADEPVELERQRLDGTWRQVSSAVTDNNGAVSFTRHPHRDAVWQLVFAGTTAYSASSASTTTLVHPVVTVELNRTTAAPGQVVTLTGTISPAPTKVIVQRQVKDASTGAWTAAGSKTIDTGTFTMRFRAPASAGTETMRVVVADDTADQRAGCNSAKLHLTVT